MIGTAWPGQVPKTMTFGTTPLSVLLMMLQERCWYPPLDHVGDRQWHGSHSFPTLETPDPLDHVGFRPPEALPLDHVGYPSPRRTTNSAGELRLDFVTNSSWKIFWNDVPLKILIIMTIRIPPFSFKFKDVHRLTPGPPGDSLTTSGPGCADQMNHTASSNSTRMKDTAPGWVSLISWYLFGCVELTSFFWLQFVLEYCQGRSRIDTLQIKFDESLISL